MPTPMTLPMPTPTTQPMPMRMTLPRPSPRSLPFRSAWLARDPRHYQILVLASLLAYGLLRLDLEVRTGQALAMGAAALAAQLACTRLARGVRRTGAPPRFDPKSACISAPARLGNWAKNIRRPSRTAPASPLSWSAK